MGSSCLGPKAQQRSNKAAQLTALALTLTGFAAWTLIAAEYEFSSLRSIQTVVAPGDPSPLGGGLTSLERAIMLGSSTVAFTGSNQGVFIHGPLGPSKIAVSGDPSPVGGSFTSFRRPFMSSDPSWVVFGAKLDDGDDGIFLWDGNSVLAVAVEDDVGWRRLDRNPAVSSLGDVAFTDGVSLIVWDGSFTTVVHEDDPNPCGGEFGMIPRGSNGGPSLNNAGAVVFGNRGYGNPEGVFLWDGASISPIACEGDATPAGGTFDRFGERPIIGDTGDVVFAGRLDSLRWGVFLYSGGVLSPIAVEGQPAPEGGSFDDLEHDLIPAVNANGDVAFVADSIVFLYSGGMVSRVIGEGDACPTGGNFGRIRGESVSLSTSGEVSFEATCTAGRGIFRSPVGGPATLLADQSTSSSIGTGFRFRQPVGTSANTLAFWGTRGSIIQARCRTSGCSDFETLVAPAAPISDLPGESVSSFTSLTGSKRALVFEAFVSGGDQPSGEYGYFIHERGSIRKVLLDGDPLPESDGESVLNHPYYSFYDVPRPSESRGRVAFLADVDDPNNYEFWQGIFVYKKGKLSTLARAGDPAPGGGTLSELSSPSISGSRVVFAARVDWDQICIFRFSLSGKQERIVCTGDSVPAPVNGTFYWLEPPAASGSRTYFTAILSDSSSEECLFVHRGKSLEILACTGDPLPGGGMIQTFLDQDYYYNRISASGSRVVTPVYDGDLYLYGYMVFKRGLATPVGLTGDPVPPPIGGTFSYSSYSPSLRGKRVAFHSYLTDGTKTSGIFLAKTKR